MKLEFEAHMKDLLGVLVSSLKCNMRFLTRTLIPSLALALNLSLHGVAHAQKWQVAGDEAFPPYVYVEGGQIKGIHVDIVRKVLDRLKVDYQIKTYPWKRVISMTDRNKITFSLSWVEKRERFQKYLMVGPIQYGRTVFMVKKNSAIQYDELKDLTPYKIGTISGYSYPKPFENAEYLDKDAATVDNAGLISKLLRGRVDIIIGDQSTLEFEAKKLGASQFIKLLPKPLKVVSRYAVFPKENAQQAAIFSNALNELKFDQEVYQSIIDQYR